VADATCTPDLLRFNLLEVVIDDTLERKLIPGLLFRDTLGVVGFIDLQYSRPGFV